MDDGTEGLMIVLDICYIYHSSNERASGFTDTHTHTQREREREREVEIDLC